MTRTIFKAVSHSKGFGPSPVGAIRLLVFLVAIVGICATCRASSEAIGHLQVPNQTEVGSESARKMLVVRGHVLTGSVKVAVIGGHTRIGDICTDCDESSQAKPFETVQRPEPSTLNDNAVKEFGSIPWVKDQVQSGRPIRDAIADFYVLQETMTTKVAAAYGHALKSGSAAPAESGRALIDPTIANKLSTGPNPTIFGKDGSVSVYVFGFGYNEVIASSSDEIQADPSIERENAQSVLASMRKAMRTPGPTFILISRTNRIILTGPRASQAILEVDRIIMNGASLASPEATDIISEEASQEIISVAARKGGRP